MQALTIDGPRWAAAHKTISTTIGKDKADPDTNQIIWVRYWEGDGIELSTFDKTRVSVAYVGQTADGIRPDRVADYTATIRANPMWHHLSAAAGRDSDQLIKVAPFIADMQATFPGMESPPGLRATLDGIEGTFEASAKGTETMHSEPWLSFIESVDPAPSSQLSATQPTFKAVADMASVVGPILITTGTKSGVGSVVTLTPAEPDALGFEFVSLMSWSPREAPSSPPDLEAVG